MEQIFYNFLSIV